MNGCELCRRLARLCRRVSINCRAMGIPLTPFFVQPPPGFNGPGSATVVCLHHGYSDGLDWAI